MYFKIYLIFLTALFVPQLAIGQTADLPSENDYLKFLLATKFVQNYKEMAEVSAQVFSVRNQKGDVEYARTMKKVANADLSSSHACIVTRVYKKQDFSQAEVRELTIFFTSPLGLKLLSESQHFLLENLKKLSAQPAPSNIFSDSERNELAKTFRTSAYQKYAVMTTDKAIAKGMVQCILEAAKVPDEHTELSGDLFQRKSL